MHCRRAGSRPCRYGAARFATVVFRPPWAGSQAGRGLALRFLRPASFPQELGEGLGSGHDTYVVILQIGPLRSVSNGVVQAS